VLLLHLFQSDWVHDLRLRSFDELQRLAPRPYEDVPVRIVDLDDATLEREGQWPWSRAKVARLVERLTELGAASIAFDIVFAESDRTAPLRLLQADAGATTDAIRSRGELERLLRELPDPDDVLAATLAESPVVTGFALTPETSARQPMARAGFAHAGQDPRQFLPEYAGAVSNLQSFEDASSGNGSFAIAPDRDGLIRRVPLLYRMGDQLYPSLAAEALRVAMGASTFVVKSSGSHKNIDFGSGSGILSVRIPPGVTIPTDSQGRLWLHFTRPQPQRFIPAWRILRGEIAEDAVAGQIVLIGTSATGLKDIRSTPLDPAAPGVVLHAEVLENILLEKALGRPDWADGAELLFTLVWGTLLALLIRRAGAIWSAALGLLGIAGAGSLSWFAFTQWQLLFDPVLPALAGLAVYLAGSLTNYLYTESERSRIRSAFAHYLSPSLVKQLATRPDTLRLGGEMRDMTILFADIRGFTSLSEQLEPQELTHILNNFLTPMTDRILERRGTIDKYMGDCIMSFWNAPLDLEAHASYACSAALAMVEELDRVNERLWQECYERGRAFSPLQIGIGLNSGECCVGNMGSQQRFDYSVLGDEVNLASRLEGQSKTYGVTIVIGDNTRQRAPEFAALELDLIRVKGKSKPVRIYTLIGDPELAASTAFQDRHAQHDALLEAYRGRDFKRALELTRICAEAAPTLQGLYDLYRERIEHYLESPPPEDWDSVYTARTK